MSPSATDDDYAYVVGIDFGTTYSGCCYAFNNDTMEDFQDITVWPKQRQVAYPKTPTVLMYKKDSQQPLAWGDAARFHANRPHLEDHLLENFKLYLDETTCATLPPLPNGLTPLQVITDYLRLLHTTICDKMHQGFAQNYTARQFRYCLTVPATWSDQAKAVMREASILAGLIERHDPPGRLSLISEPEAAALYCQKTLDQFNLVHGQRFMICDAGGGTVDLVVFEINDTGTRSLKEVTKGSGDMCGSTFLDKHMEYLIRDRFAHFGHVNDRAMEQMMTVFIDRIKPHFDDDDEDHFIPIPFALGYPLGQDDDEANGILDGTLVFKAEELKAKVFEPVVLKVLHLIKDQLDGSALKPVDAIFMVGGFGKSSYLYRRVNDSFVPRVKFVGIPPRAEMAVVRGAVYFGLNPRIVAQRISRRTYGLKSVITFDDRLDSMANHFMVGSKSYCRERFSIYAHKGQPIGVDECVTKRYMVTYPHSTETDLYAYDDDGAVPRLVSDPKVHLVARFPVQMPTLTNVPIGQEVEMTVNMYFGQTEIKIEVLIQDRRCVFTSRLDLLTADSFNSPQQQQHEQLPLERPPPYSSPLLSTQALPRPPLAVVPNNNNNQAFGSTSRQDSIQTLNKPDSPDTHWQRLDNINEKLQMLTPCPSEAGSSTHEIPSAPSMNRIDGFPDRGRTLTPTPSSSSTVPTMSKKASLGSKFLVKLKRKDRH